MKSPVYQTALNLLSRRDHSCKELTQKLQAKGHPSEEIEAVVNSLVTAGYINEARFTENYIRSRRAKGVGPERILLELQERGITDKTIAELLNITDNAWILEVRSVWRKHFKSKLPADFKTKAKQMRFLKYRGFTQEQINCIFKETYDDQN